MAGGAAGLMHSMFQRCGITPAQVLGINKERLNARAHAEFLMQSEIIAQEGRAAQAADGR